MSYQVAILAGGKSRRFGSNKALFKIDGKTLISRQIAEIIKLKNQPENLFISISNEAQRDDIIDSIGKRIQIPMEFVVDVPRDDLDGVRAPIFGMHALFKRVEAGTIQFMPCDTPNFSSFFMNQLYTRMETSPPGCAALIPRWRNGYYEPLHGLYKPEICLENLETILKAGDLKLINFIESGIAVQFLKIEETLEAIDPGFKTFTNINFKDEFCKE